MTLRLRDPRVAKAFAVSIGLALLCAAYREGISAYGEGAETHPPSRLPEVAELIPGNAEIWRKLGQEQLESDPDAAAEHFRRAVALNPYDSQALIGLGLLAETAGQMSVAEQYFQQAAARSKRFRPQFALAYFYARQAPLEKFWPAAIRAASVEAADLRPLFSLVHATIPPSGMIGQHLRLTTQHSLASYTQFLLEQASSPGLADTAIRIEPVPSRRSLLVAVVDRLLQQSSVVPAMQIWNRLHPGSLDPEKGRSVTNPNFSPGEGAGFDWRLNTASGVPVRQIPDSLRIELSGRQSEDVVIVEQWLPVLPNRNYLLQWTAAVSGPAIRAGLHWKLNPHRSFPIAPKPGEHREDIGFTTGPHEDLVRLALCYTRPSGATRMEGVLDVHSVELRLR